MNMNTARQFIDRVGYKYLDFTNQIRVVGYTNAYVRTEGVKTRIHLNNIISPFLPQYDDPVDFKIQFFSQDGVLLKILHRTLERHGCSFIDVDEALSGIESPFGMVVVNAELSKAIRSRLTANKLRMVSSHYFVTWETQEGGINCSHCIESYNGSYFGIPGFMKGWIKPNRPIQNWISNSGIMPHGLEKMRLYFTNPGKKTILSDVEIRQNAQILHKEQLHLKPYGTGLLSIAPPQLKSFDPKGASLVIKVDALTGNAKPYAFLKYKGRGYLAHHA
ncbi:hypothetical protein K2X30_10820 [bacterium]|nr:hypothetical protein [bacterium]